MSIVGNSFFFAASYAAHFEMRRISAASGIVKVLWSAHFGEFRSPAPRSASPKPVLHETILLDKGVPVHVVADRCGHDPAVLLRIYAKRTKKADATAAGVISTLSAGILGGK
jgi:hypothetical protein